MWSESVLEQDHFCLTFVVQGLHNVVAEVAIWEVKHHLGFGSLLDDLCFKKLISWLTQSDMLGYSHFCAFMHL